jgi:hypothetical protein
MFKIYDDTDESTVPTDLKYSRILILLSVATSLTIVTLASLSDNMFYQISKSYGNILFISSGLLSYFLYYRMYSMRKYPTIYASLSLSFLGFSSFLSGFNSSLGIGLIVFSLIYIPFYLVTVRYFNLDNPDL